MVTPATVADHVVPHKGNEELFWCGEVQSLCKSCHDGPVQQMELGTWRPAIGVDGYPATNEYLDRIYELKKPRK